MGWVPPPPPAPPPSNWHPRWVVAGVAAGILLVVLLVVVAAATARDVVPEWLLGVIVFGPAALGMGLTAVPGRTTRRAFGVGLVMGGAVGLIVSAGLCIGGAISTPFYRVG